MSVVNAGRSSTAVDPFAAMLAASSLAFLIFDGWVITHLEHGGSPDTATTQFVFTASWLAVGLVAIGLRRSELARRILTLSCLLAADLPGAFNLLDGSVVARVLVTVATALGPLHIPAAAHVMMSFPSGGMRSRTSRRVLAAAYAVGVCEGAWWTLTDVTGTTCPGCATAVEGIDVSSSTHRFVITGLALCWIIVVLFICQRMLSRYRHAGPRQRRMLRIPYVVVLVLLPLFVALILLGTQKGSGAFGTSVNATLAFTALSVIVPLSFLVALVQERLSYKRIGELVVTLAGGAGTDLERSLAVALGDPHLRVAFPVAGGYVDTQGRPTPAPDSDGRTTVTTVGDPKAPMALITHDRSLSEEPALLTAAGSATRLILENARLQAEVRAQLLEVRESRTRIVTATNEARARLERDLHDGAQQRLLAIGLALQLLRQQPGNPVLLEAAENELSSALAEMRELASGIHPAVLTDLGLVPALEALVGRLGTRVRLDVPDPVRRCSPEVEAAAYFSATEAITNALKHAAPASIEVTVADPDEWLVIRVRDDGRGGADADGTGLMGIRDRLASVDGTLIVASPPGRGTELTMEIPCA